MTKKFGKGCAAMAQVWGGKVGAEGKMIGKQEMKENVGEVRRKFGEVRRRGSRGGSSWERDTKRWLKCG